MDLTRRTFLTLAPGAASGAVENTLAIDPRPRHDLSPYLYMQFMEPLGSTDSSVEAAWDHGRQDWREDVVGVTRELAPGMIRWGGIFTDYYRWREGVGPRDRRPPMRNLLWGGIESNQVGTAEFVDFCRRTGAEPLICVNFESDGRPVFMKDGGSIRTADAKEAAEWVAYANRPDHPERTAHGSREPFGIRFWQIGNETSYSEAGFDLAAAGRKTREFALAMREADPKIRLIAWGESPRRAGGQENWARGMAGAAGDQIDYLAFHHMFNPDDPQAPVLAWNRFRDNPARTWDQLMAAWRIHDAKIRRVREEAAGTGKMLAMTECHFSIPGRNRNELLSTWAAGVAYARMLNVHERHGDVLKIATAADFCGTRWQVNAVMIPVPGGQSFLMPVAHVMRLYRKHTGERAATVTAAPPDLDVTASRTGDRLFLHVVNTNRTRPASVRITAAGRSIGAGRVFEIAADPMFEVMDPAPALSPKRKSLAPGGNWTFPAASVSAVELELA
jgi:alpha-L-arabinofuranosidase